MWELPWMYLLFVRHRSAWRYHVLFPLRDHLGGSVSVRDACVYVLGVEVLDVPARGFGVVFLGYPYVSLSLCRQYEGAYGQWAFFVGWEDIDGGGMWSCSRTEPHPRHFESLFSPGDLSLTRAAASGVSVHLDGSKSAQSCWRTWHVSPKEKTQACEAPGVLQPASKDRLDR